MSDHERGAYTPQPDAPLSFDARVSREARPLPLALIFSCIVLAALVVALFLFYQSGVRKPSDQPPPVGTPVEQFKSPPPPAAPNGLTVVAAQPAAPAPSAEPIATSAGPEQPVARSATPPAASPPAAPAPVVAKPAETPAPAAVAKAAPVAAAPAAKPAPTPAPVKAPVAHVAAAKPATPASRADPVGSLLDSPKPAKPVKAASAKAAPAPAAGVTGAAVVQIGAFATEAQAGEGWNRVAGLMGGAVSGKGRKIEPVQVGAATRYRSQVTGFASHADAVAFCTTLKARHQDCIVKPAS